MHSENRKLFLVLSIWSLVLLPWLFGKGIFADGLYYGTIARNWCFGTGDLWQFYVSESLMNPFYSHPPLAFWIQGSLFCIFGDYWWMDRAFSLLCFVLTATAMLGIWRLFFRHGKTWLPLFILLLLPTASWAYNNNVLENSMGTFCIWAVYLQLSAIKSEKLGLLKNIFSGLLIFAAVLCKGPTGLFPLALPFMLLIYNREINIKGVLMSFLPILTFILSLLLLLYSDDARTYLKAYFEIQIQGSFSLSEKSGEALMLKQLLVEILPLGAIVFLLLYWIKKKIQLGKEALLFFLIAASASLPILISPKQMGFYILPSLPFWALGFSALLQGINLSKIVISKNVLILSSVLLFTISILSMLYNFGQPIRDLVLLNDIEKISTILPKKSKAGLDPKLSEHWKVQGYFAREKSISFYPIGHAKYKYNIGTLEYSLPGCEIVYKGKELQLCQCPMPE